MPIHVAITRRILPGKEKEFHDSLRQFMGQSFAHDAVHGAGIITFPHEDTHEIGILRTFENERKKDEFYNSKMFKEWDAYASTLTEGEAKYRILTGLEAWFRSPGTPPPRWKMALVTLMGVYPSSLFLTYTIGELVVHMPVLVKNLVFSVGMVCLLTWVIMPFLTKRLKGWLTK